MLPKKIFQVEFSENYQWFWLGAIVGLSIFGCINYKIVIIIRWQYWIIFIGIEIRFRGPKRRFTIEIINQSFGKCQFFRFISFVKNMSRMRHIFQMTIQVKDMALSLFFKKNPSKRNFKGIHQKKSWKLKHESYNCGGGLGNGEKKISICEL